jgi:16S rRNA (cytosine967-C5)-methyltransferase
LRSREVDLLARVLYEVVERRVSLDVAFKRVCGGRCARGLEERERLYQLCRRFVSDYVKLLCYLGGRRVSYRRLARLWLGGPLPDLDEPYCRLSTPRWLYERVSSLLGAVEAERVFRAFEERSWWLRVNTFRGSEEGVIRELESEGVEVEVHRELPYMVRVVRSPKPVRLLRAVREFRAVPQDVASAVAVEYLDIRPGDVVLDMCAAPGLKTSLISMLSGGEARVVAVDVSLRRLLAAKHLLRRMGVPETSVNLVLADSTYINARSVDKVLLDAPCSNSGAIGKDPGVKATLTPGKVEYYRGTQLRLLTKALQLSDVVVYSVCSILPEEGEEVVTEVLKAYTNLRVVPHRLARLCSPGYRGYPVSDSVCRMFPHTHLSDGFFIARLERVGS